jgi:hypothetical protein
MSIPFSEKEFEVKGMFLNTTRSFGVPREIWNFPITVAENLKAAISGKDYMYMPTVGDIVNIESRVNLDHIARAEVMDLGPEQTLEEKGGPDLFGVKWVFVPQVGGSMEDPDIPHLLNDANEWYDKVKFPDIDALDWDSVGELNAPFRKETRIVGCCFQNGLFERLISFMGFENAAMALIDEDQQDALKALFAKTTKLYMDIVDKYAEYFPEVDALNVHDDWGSQKSPFFSQDAAMEMIVPFMKQLTDHIKARGFVADLHSCGHTETRVEAYIAGGWQSWMPQTMNDTEKLFQEYGDRIIVTVNVELPKDLTEEQQRDAAKRFVETHCIPGKKLKVTADSRLVAFETELYKQSRLAYLSF